MSRSIWLEGLPTGNFDFELQFLYQFHLGHATFALADWN